jgi:hypothetical protein
VTTPALFVCGAPDRGAVGRFVDDLDRSVRDRHDRDDGDDNGRFETDERLTLFDFGEREHERLVRCAEVRLLMCFV